MQKIIQKILNTKKLSNETKESLIARVLAGEEITLPSAPKGRLAPFIEIDQRLIGETKTNDTTEPTGYIEQYNHAYYIVEIEPSNFHLMIKNKYKDFCNLLCGEVPYPGFEPKKILRQATHEDKIKWITENPGRLVNMLDFITHYNINQGTLELENNEE